MRLIKLGSLYFANSPTSRKSAWEETDGPISIGNTIPGQELQWYKWKGLLIGDACACTGISWKDLDALGYAKGWPVSIDGIPYLCRCPLCAPSPIEGCEWYEFALNFDGDGENKLNWFHQFFWGMEIADEGIGYIRGAASPVYWKTKETHLRLSNIGFRPVLEALPPLPNLDEVKKGSKIDVYGSNKAWFRGKLASYDDYDIILDKCDSPLPSNCTWATFVGKGKIVISRAAVTWLSETKKNTTHQRCI